MKQKSQFSYRIPFPNNIANKANLKVLTFYIRSCRTSNELKNNMVCLKIALWSYLFKFLIYLQTYERDRTFIFSNCSEKIFFSQWLGHWIPIPGVQGSKPLGGSKVDLAFHPSEVNQMSTRTSWRFSGLSPRSGSAALIQLNPINKKGP